MKFLLSLAIVAFATIAAAQTSIVIPVVAKDTAGRAVTGLQATDFGVKTGKGITFDQIEEVGPASIAGDPAQAPIYIVFDATSVAPPVQGIRQKALLDFLVWATKRRERITMLVNTGQQLRVVHEFQVEPDVFLAAAKRVQGGEVATSSGSDTPTAADSDFETKVSSEAARVKGLIDLTPASNIASVPITFGQLAALQQLGNMLQNSPKRKAVIWVGAMFPLQVDSNGLDFNTQNANNTPGLGKLVVAYEKAIEELNSAHISVYPYQVQGVAPPSPIFSYAERTQYGFDLLARLWTESQ